MGYNDANAIESADSQLLVESTDPKDLLPSVSSSLTLFSISSEFLELSFSSENSASGEIHGKNCIVSLGKPHKSGPYFHTPLYRKYVAFHALVILLGIRKAQPSSSTDPKSSNSIIGVSAKRIPIVRLYSSERGIPFPSYRIHWENKYSNHLHPGHTPWNVEGTRSLDHLLVVYSPPNPKIIPYLYMVADLRLTRIFQDL